MRTSREVSSSSVVGVASRAGEACGQAPAMEEGAGVNPGCTPGRSVLYSPTFRALVGGECLQILRCGICMEFFNIPIVLPCGHTFCLQCLTEMCKHATDPRGPGPVLTEVLIGCPNCRVQIFATPILQRNVTCNFIIQSLVDILRNRKVPHKTDVSVNTDRSMVGPPVRAITQEGCEVLQEVDRLTTSLRQRSVVDDAFYEIESIRRLHLANLQKAGGDSVKVRSGSQRTNNATRSSNTPANTTTTTAAAHTAFNRETAPSTSTFAPQFSLTTYGDPEQTPAYQIRDTTSPNSRRCYAAALALGRDRTHVPCVQTTSTNTTIKTTRTNNTAMNMNVRCHRPQCGGSIRTLPQASSSSSASGTRSAELNQSQCRSQSSQNSPTGGFRNKNRNNSKLSPELVIQPVDDTRERRDTGHSHHHHHQQQQQHRQRQDPTAASKAESKRACSSPCQQDWELMTGCCGQSRGRRRASVSDKAPHDTSHEDPSCPPAAKKQSRRSTVYGPADVTSDVRPPSSHDVKAPTSPSRLMSLLVDKSNRKGLSAKLLIRLQEARATSSVGKDLFLLVRLP